MPNTYAKPQKTYKNTIRKFNINNVVTGEFNSLPFMKNELNSSNKQLTIIEIPLFERDSYPVLLLNNWSDINRDNSNLIDYLNKQQADIISLVVNLKEFNQSVLDKTVELITYISRNLSKPLMINATDKREINEIIIPILANALEKKCIFGIIDEDNYKNIIPSLTNKNHYWIARTPIDINLAKQLNILLTDAGIDPDNIIIDPNIGALGYGLDYAYSVIERIRIAALDGDNMLNMPILAFAGEEAWKTKEAKAKFISNEAGEHYQRAIMWETVTASSMITAGADMVALYHSDSVEKIAEFIERGQ
ncbi:MAG: hypothetical protein WCK67_01820 [bacterium]